MAFKALELFILTAPRTGKAPGIFWIEVAIAKGIKVIRAQRMKARQEHRVPLSQRAVEILRHWK